MAFLFALKLQKVVSQFNYTILKNYCKGQVLGLQLNFMYGGCVFIGYLGVLSWRADMVVGCIALALFGNYAKRGLKLGVYK